MFMNVYEFADAQCVHLASSGKMTFWLHYGPARNYHMFEWEILAILTPIKTHGDNHANKVQNF